MLKKCVEMFFVLFFFFPDFCPFFAVFSSSIWKILTHTPGQSLAWWVRISLKSSGALKDNKDFLVGKTGLESTFSILTFSRYDIFCLCLNLTLYIAKSRERDHTVMNRASVKPLHRCSIRVHFHIYNDRPKTSCFQHVVGINALQVLRRKELNPSRFSQSCSTVQNV